MVSKNELGEEISSEDFADLVQRIRKLSDEQIDELWFKCGFIYADDFPLYREKKFKAISQEFLDKIRKSTELAAEVIGHMWSESKTEEIKVNLNKLEE